MKVLVIHPTPRPFIALDVEILQSAFIVRTTRVRFTPRSSFAADTLAALRNVLWADVVLAWFGGLHALLPFLVARMLGKRCTIIASGVDVAAMPSIDYGHMRPGRLRVIGRLVFRLAHRVFAVSAFTAREAVRNARTPASKVASIPHGVPPSPSLESSPDRSGVMTVATANARTIPLKGLTTFIQAAARLPDVPFSIVGGGDRATLQSIREAAPPNVTFIDWLASDALRHRMRRCKVYAQLSAYESFGMALAEAMQCGCVPVVTRRGALPNVVGPVGWYVPYGDAAATACAIREALAAPPEASDRARRRIETCFPVAQRRRALVNAIRNLTP
jgi:glycosyltransferase involved in cell wall biosynthesis